MCVGKHHTLVQRLPNYFLSQITSYLEPLLSTSYSLLQLEYSSQVKRRSEKPYTEQNLPDCSGLQPTLVPHWCAHCPTCSPASIPCLGSQCLWWLEAIVPSTCVPHPSSPPAHHLAILLWNRDISLGDCREAGSLSLENPWDSRSSNHPSLSSGKTFFYPKGRGVSRGLLQSLPEQTPSNLPLMGAISLLIHPFTQLSFLFLNKIYHLITGIYDSFVRFLFWKSWTLSEFHSIGYQMKI